MNIEKWYNNFVTDLSLKYNSDKTIRMYSHNVKRFLYHFNSYREPKEIPNNEIKDYLLSFNTLNTRKQNLCALKRFYELTVKMPKKVKRIPYPKKSKSLPRVIEPEYLKKTILSITNLKHRALLALGYSCALRRSEVINLKMECIDRKRMLILIKNAKGNKDRYVKLSNGLLEILEVYARKYRPKVYLFNGQFDIQYSESSYNNVVKKYLGNEYSTHSLRHSGATAMHESGTDLAIIQKMLGHKKIETTMIYTHISQKAIQKVNSPI